MDKIRALKWKRDNIMYMISKLQGQMFEWECLLEEVNNEIRQRRKNKINKKGVLKTPS